MLYSEKELEKRLKAGCALYSFYASDEALVHTAAQKTLKYLNRDDPETTVLDGPTPSVEEIVLAAGTISFFGGKRLVLMPLIRPSTYSDKDLQELCADLCMECGCCSYVCPAKRHIVQTNKLAKAKLRDYLAAKKEDKK